MNEVTVSLTPEEVRILASLIDNLEIRALDAGFSQYLRDEVRSAKTKLYAALPSDDITAMDIPY